MICRNTRGLSFTEIIMSLAIISILILVFARFLNQSMQAKEQDRMQIQANHFSQMIIEELKTHCIPEDFIVMKENFTTDDWESNRDPREFPDLRGKVDIGALLPNGQRKTTVTISFRNWLDGNNQPKQNNYYITLVKNTGLEPNGAVSGRVVNYVTGRGIPDAEVSAPSWRIDGVPTTSITDSNGEFTLLGVKVGNDISVTAVKLGTVPNNLDYSPGYYFDPDLLELGSTAPKTPITYANPNYKNDLSSAVKTNCTVTNGLVSDVGSIYMCPMAVVRGWVREDETDSDTGVGKFLVYIGYAGNFNDFVLDKGARNSMHPYYPYSSTHPGTSSAPLLDDFNDSVMYFDTHNNYWRGSGYYATTRETTYTNTYNVEGTPIPFTLEKGEYVFFNVRPGCNSSTSLNTYVPYIRAMGRPGSKPTVPRSSPDFEWGYVRNYVWVGSGNSFNIQPYISVAANNCFDSTGSNTTIKPLFRNALGNHSPLPVMSNAYRYYFHTYPPQPTTQIWWWWSKNLSFNPIAKAAQGNITNVSYDGTQLALNQTSYGVDFTQPGWNNYEALIINDEDLFPTCFVARRRGGIQGTLVDTAGQGINGITLRSKAWADTNDSLSWEWVYDFNQSHCPTTISGISGTAGYFELNNIYAMEQNFAVTRNPTSPPAGWNAHIGLFETASIQDTSVQDYAILRIDDDDPAPNYMPLLIKPFDRGILDHLPGNEYPMPTWARNIGTNNAGITDFGSIILPSTSDAVTVTGRIVKWNNLSSSFEAQEDYTIKTLGILGIDFFDVDNELLINNKPGAFVQATTGTNGMFTLAGVMPSFIPLIIDNIQVDNYNPQVTHPDEHKKSLTPFQITSPNTISYNNVSIQGHVTDIYSGEPVADAVITAAFLDVRTNTPDDASRIDLSCMTTALGEYTIGPDIDDVPVYFYYYEHLPATNADPYIPMLGARWIPGTPNTVNLGDITIGGPATAKNMVFRAEKFLTDETLPGSYDPATTFDTAGNVNNGIYLVQDNVTIANANITLIKRYRCSFFGRVLDGEDNPLENALIRIEQWNPYMQFGGPDTPYDAKYFTNAQGYWGDWSPVTSPNVGGPEINLPINAWSRYATAPDEPGKIRWNIKIWAYAPTGIDLVGDDYRDSLIGFPAGWTDGGAVQIPDFELPRYFDGAQ